MRTVITNEALERSLSRDRLEKYLRATEQDFDAALSVYEWNTKISEAFYTPLQCVEVCLRNSINLQMTAAFGEEWYHADLPDLRSDSCAMIFDAVDVLRKDQKEVTAGRVVAELKFAFWVGLMGPRYDSTLWRKVIHKAFLAGGGKPRRDVHGRFNAIRRFRNRIAHHEPIFERNLDRTHAELIEAIGWMCTETAKWATQQSRVVEVIKYLKPSQLDRDM